MISVSDATKTAWASGSSEKTLKIQIGNVTIDNVDIKGTSFKLTESIIASDSLEFIGCIARKVEFSITTLGEANLKNQKCTISLRANTTDWIPVFVGYVDESKREGMKGAKRIVAYDIFCKFQQTDATDWYNSLGLCSLIEAFVKFSTDFGMPYNHASVSFVNATIPCYGGTKKQAKNMTALDFLKQICQINGCIGYIDGNGLFCVRYIDAVAQRRLFPADSLFPSQYIFPSDYDGGSASDTTTVPYYRDLEYEDYRIKQIDKVTIRNKSDDVGTFYPYSGDNNYIIQGNIFAYDQASSTLLGMAQRIYNVVKNANFRPFKATHMAFPWLECGDKLVYYDIDDEGETVEVDFIMMSRYMSGDQMMWDTYSAEGEQDQRIFITDLSAQIEDLQEQIDDLQPDTPDGNLYDMVTVEYTDVIETPTMGGIEDSVSGIATEV